MSTRDAPARIGDLPPIGRPANSALLAAGVTTLAQVATHRPAELLAMHGVGPKAIRLLSEALADHGLTWAGE
ncbi:DNA-binding protein [Actinoplanes hulinensis]|uniref:DNA-binding protein n=1 Tax=Actinoplanes hulinensis TaxID=1144547 RepID=A0ABS7B4C5_9ACTN|nr:DNA-binding protein [Actinoplanes hulinensis]MBW6435866.1 DNA-binding protein [Actinoplanes hulinensis]